jgi:hypothetical protein
MDKDIELRKLVIDTWEEMNRTFVPKNHDELQSFLCNKFAQKRGSSKGIYCAPHPGQPRNKTDIEVDNKVFVELKLQVRKWERRTDSDWWNRITRHAIPCVKKLGGIKKKRPDALCYYAVYAATYKGEDENWWKIVRDMCNAVKIEPFLLCWKKSDS